jgi:D-alanine--poly(phosphoribitol) ligase subunit 2
MAMTTELGAIRQFITTQFLFDFDDRVTVDADLFDLGLVDSYGFVELVRFLESEYGVRFSDEELASKCLHSLASIEGVMRTKLDERR